ncbi:hypothetical protein B0H17DRAFT_922117, partial [Mycena rosella]
PFSEWLRNKATPLIVLKERVMKALAWLKVHNHLYRDVLVDKSVLCEHDNNDLLPFHIQHISPSAGIDLTTSDYVPGSSFLPNPPFVVVADVDRNAPSHFLRAEALKHLKKSSNNYVEVPHDRKAVNKFNNPDLFPMMYLTLLPYGFGGLEDPRRRTPLSFKRHVKHLFNLVDRRFQEHYSFLFTAFNTRYAFASLRQIRVW